MKKNPKKPIQVKPAYFKWDDDVFKALSLFCGDTDKNPQMPRVFIALWHYLTLGDSEKAEKECELNYREAMFFRLAIKKVVRGE